MSDKTIIEKQSRPGKYHFQRGLRDGLPVAIGYLPIAVTFGVISRTAGLPSLAAVLMSLLVFAGASQFVAVELIAAGTAFPGIVATTFFVNLRHILMSATVSEKLPGLSRGWLAVLAFGITDESFSLLATDRRHRLPAFYVLGVILLPYLAWTAGSAAGVVLGGQLPGMLESSMEIALYAMFLGLIAPEIKSSSSKLKVALIALALSSLISWNPLHNISQGWRITLSTVGAAFLGAVIFTGDDKDE